MKKVTAFVGSSHKGGAAQTAARLFLEKLEALGDVQTETVILSDHTLALCRGCKVCFDHDEKRCPLKDDRDLLIEKISASDGVVFASPNYSFQVSALMKLFLDRLGFLFHRPRFHGKTATSIVVFGIYGGRKIAKYLDFAEGGLGFHVVKGSSIRTLEPMTEKAKQKREKTLTRQSRRFHTRLFRPTHTSPPLLGLMVFRMSRTKMHRELSEGHPDFVYFRDKGWFESEYYYPTRLGLFKKAAGVLFDWIGARG